MAPPCDGFRFVSDSAHWLDVSTVNLNSGSSKRLSRKPPMPEVPTKEYLAKRRSRRAKIAGPLRVRPSDPRDEHFEDLPVSVNASKEGIYFTTRRSSYYKGMRVFVTF